MNYSVSIIVPIYNVEKYIEKCVISLLEQDFDSIEYIFVNDCTPDKSISVLESVIEHYPDRKPHIKIIHHDKNKGLGAARKTGLQSSTGEYVQHIDSDDWCELNMVSSLYQTAKMENADMVMCDFYESYPVKNKYHSIEYKKGREFADMLSANLIGACWNKLIKRSLYFDNYIFPPTHISMAEDKHLMIRLAFFAKKFSYVERAFIHYRQDNVDALTKKITEKKRDEIEVFLKDIKAFIVENKLYHDYFFEYSMLFLSHHHYLFKNSRGEYGFSDYRKYLDFTSFYNKNIKLRECALIVLYFFRLNYIYKC